MKNKNFFGCRFGFPFLKKLIFLTMISAAICATAKAEFTHIDTEDAREMVEQAEKLAHSGQFAEAEKILRRAISQYPKDSSPKLTLAYLLLKQKKIVSAFDLAYPVAEAEPKNSYAFAILGMIYLDMGDFASAEKLLVNSAILNKKEALAWAGLGMLDFYHNRIEQSLEKLRASVDYDKDEPDFIYTLAQVASRAEKYKEAAGAYRRFLRVSGERDEERRERIKGLIRFLAFLGNRSSLYDVGGKDKTKISVRIANDRPFIEVRINGKDAPLKFVLDTGSGMTVISNETAEKLKIKPVTKGGLARALGGDGKFEIVYGFLRSVEIGDVKVRNVPVYIREFHNRSESIDGYIGLSLISKFLTTIDYGNRTFSMIRNSKADEQKAKANAMKLPLRLTSSGFLSGEVLLEGVTTSLSFIVDTGASISVISDEVAEMETIKKFESEEKLRVIGAAGITENVPSFLLPKVTFGKYSREKVRAIALDLDIINEAAGYQQAGILGGNFLKNYSVTFDFDRSEVTFVPNDP